MTSRDFCFWLQGYFEVSGEKTISGDQVETIKRHLALVFCHEIDPSMGANQNSLNDLHQGTNIGGEVLTPVGPVKYRC
jgi:hypothetical protein